MHPPKAVTDGNIDRLVELMGQLTKRLLEARNVRARFLEARDANVWPDLRSASLMFSNPLASPQFPAAKDNGRIN